MQNWLEPLAGGVVLAITLLDVFLTVLYARTSTGLLAPEAGASPPRPCTGTHASRSRSTACS